MRRLFLLMAAGLLAACGSDLSTLTAPTLAAQLVGTPLFLHVGASNSGCPSVSSAVHASLDGSGLHADSLGGSGGGLLGGCNNIQFSGSIASSPDAAFVVADGSTTWTMTVPGYFAPRQLEVTAPGLVIHPGDTVMAAAVPATDFFDTSPGASASFQSDDGKTSFVVKSGVAVNGATFQFVVPSTTIASDEVGAVAAAASPGTLTVNPGLAYARVATCAGPTRCTAQLDTDYSARVTLQAR